MSWRLGLSAASSLPRPVHSQQHVVMLHSDVCDVGAARWAWRMACATVAVPAHVDLHELTRLGPSAASPLPRPVHSQQHVAMLHSDVCDVGAARWAWRMACATVAVPAHVDLHELAVGNEARVRPPHFHAPCTHSSMSPCYSPMCVTWVQHGGPGGWRCATIAVPAHIALRELATRPECGLPTSTSHASTSAYAHITKVRVRCT